ncbi:Predicted nucleotidyltransferase [Dethiosulfatibacter aminovorans DSM 17477]|uniref:tRNA(Met) cytidine acetate ligase n=1 Tax=Dethiosulfatibacter aminovorans DSM 17477 TaxID=1121476 RepID=A0A1M6DHG0_9FIRM|nr:nucleotidyltransferase [Dethiosulfatibacter aminovorans]SHI72571.1 Predicted nucleotidyltransferase [Dethiosulfatibacter aminovorans DSM 17477]
MNNIGIISEFNPFHNGHEYLLKKVKEKYKPDCIVIIMSGNFVQRGDMAIIDKWRRAEAAVIGGGNIVLELPLPYAVQNAEMFAKGALGILSKMDVGSICFGTESKDLNDIINISKLLSKETLEFKAMLKSNLNKGYSYPMAISMTVGENLDHVFTPNNILGIEYVKTIIKNNYNIKPLNIERIGSSYNSSQMEGQYSSASAIRNTLLGSNDPNVFDSVPLYSHERIMSFLDSYGKFNSLNHCYPLVQYKMLSSSHNDLTNIYDMKEGIENRFKKNLGIHESLDQFIKGVKSKRFTYSRIQRIILNTLLNLTNDLYESIQIENINNVRVLSFDKKGQLFMKNNKHRINFITKKSDFNHKTSSLADRKIFEATNKASQIYNFSVNSKNLNSEATSNPSIVDKS